MTTTGSTAGEDVQRSSHLLAPDHPLSHRTAADVMSAHVVTVAGSAGVGEALTLMRHWAVRHLPVTRDERFVGMVDDRMLAFALLSGDGWSSAVDRPVETVMMRYVPQVGPDTPMPRVANLLRSSRCDVVVVVDERDRLLGLVTMVDVVTAVARIDVDQDG